MKRNDIISGVLWTLSVLIIVGSILLGLYFVSVGGGFFYFIVTLFTGGSVGMLFLGISIIIMKLDDLGAVLNASSNAHETNEEEVTQ